MARIPATTFAGPCKGGPWDGKLYAHWSAGPVPIFKPVISMPLPGQRMDTMAVQPMETGRYEWSTEAWFWIPARGMR